METAAIKSFLFEECFTVDGATIFSGTGTTIASEEDSPLRGTGVNWEVQG